MTDPSLSCEPSGAALGTRADRGVDPLNLAVRVTLGLLLSPALLLVVVVCGVGVIVEAVRKLWTSGRDTPSPHRVDAIWVRQVRLARGFHCRRAPRETKSRSSLALTRDD